MSRINECKELYEKKVPNTFLKVIEHAEEHCVEAAKKGKKRVVLKYINDDVTYYNYGNGCAMEIAKDDYCHFNILDLKEELEKMGYKTHKQGRELTVSGWGY